MTNEPRPFSHYLAPALLLLGAALAGANWYLQPERAAAWAITLSLIAFMALALLIVPRYAREAARESVGQSIRSAGAFAGLTLVATLSLKLAFAFGILDDGELSRRAAIIILGGFLVSMGNSMPKRLTPLAALQCSPAKVQAFQRFTGWTWVLTGLAFMIAWLALPIDLAKPASMVVLVSGMFLTIARIVQLRLTRARIAVVFALAAAATPVRAQVEVVGDWHGPLQTPIGTMTLIITVAKDQNGALRGEMQSPDQGPGKIPLTTISATDGRLAFTVRGAQISYEGNWVEAEQHWTGTFTQGGKTPLTLRRGLPPARAVIEGLDGLWEGSVRRNGVDLRLLLRVTTSERGTIVQLDSPDLGAVRLPVEGFSRQARSVGFSVPASGARFAGTLSDDGTRLSGTWTVPNQPDAEVVFVRTRSSADREARPRPQMPKAPFPYRAEDVAFDNAAAKGVTLSGTLTVPEGSGPFPAAILITGSGPQDRDETVFGHKPFAVLADHLTRHGVAVLRYDDRGAGKSTGDFATATSADFATDANAAVRFLGTRPEIDHDAIGLIGHSEGGMVAPIAAAASADVRFIVLLAGPGTDLAQLALSQQRLLGLSQGVSDAELARMEPVMTRVFSAVAKSSSAEDAQRRVRGVLTPDALAALRAPESQREAMVQRFSSDWFRFFLQYKPATNLARVRVPVLALNGTLDRQVPADENLGAIAAALAGNPDVTIRKLDGLNHFFQSARTGAIGEYADLAETMSPIVLGIVSDWIGARFRRPPAR